MFFDFHPKGVLPLDGADIVATSLTDGPKVEGARVVPGIDIAHPSFGGRSLSLAVEDEAMRNTWVAAMEASKHVTYKNAVTGAWRRCRTPAHRAPPPPTSQAAPAWTCTRTWRRTLKSAWGR